MICNADANATAGSCMKCKWYVRSFTVLSSARARVLTEWTVVRLGQLTAMQSRTCAEQNLRRTAVP